MKNKNKIFIILIFLAIIAGFVITNLNETNIDVYLNEENVTSSIYGFNSNFNTDRINKKITDYIHHELYNPNSNVDTIRDGIEEICRDNGINNPKVHIDSIFGKNKLPVSFKVEGRSMIPTLADGEDIVVEKTKDISKNDIVVANSSQYGIIVKRVSDIENNKVHLVSDNKNIEIQKIGSKIYQSKGISTYVNLSDIYGIVKIY